MFNESIVYVCDIKERLNELRLSGKDDDLIEQLESILDEVGNCDILIHESHIDQYIEDEILECCDIPDWLYNYIEWDRLINNSLIDYFEIIIEDETYFAR